MDNDTSAIRVIEELGLETGLMWDKISEFSKRLSSFEESVSHKVGESQSEKLKEQYPLKQHIEGGLYTRELFMKKGSIIISMIHKQKHPSFLLKGKVSYLTDKGEVDTISAPHTIFTQEGSQRVFYVHEDTQWCCVYKTEAKSFEEAEFDVYVDDYRNLPKETIEKIKKLWQD
jgi:hypothetical protein|tara:strand:- start:10 stop:528 length:519 start_codon:yes stop_codon:yes gene_type:complete